MREMPIPLSRLKDNYNQPNNTKRECIQVCRVHVVRIGLALFRQICCTFVWLADCKWTINPVQYMHIYSYIVFADR